MRPTTKGVVDVVFCIDASASMAPCIGGLRRNLGAFLDGLGGGWNRRYDCRLDFLAHSCDPSGSVVRSSSLRHQGAELLANLYGPTPNPNSFFTSEPASIRVALEDIAPLGDEAILLALDTCLDFPWRPRAGCHRVVVVLTDEPLESNAAAIDQKRMIGPVIDKIQALGVMLFLVAPRSEGYNELAEADKSQYQQVAQTHDGLGSLDFSRVLSHIGKSVSTLSLHYGPEPSVPLRPLRPEPLGFDGGQNHRGVVGMHVPPAALMFPAVQPRHFRESAKPHPMESPGSRECSIVRRFS